MSYQPYDEGYGEIPQYPSGQPRPQNHRQQQHYYHTRRMPSPDGQQRRGPPLVDAGHGPSPRAQRPIRSDQPSAGVSGGRPRQHAEPHADGNENLYDGRAYGGSDYVEYEPDQWPLPTPVAPYRQERRAPSPQRNSPRRPPQRPQRPDAQPTSIDPSWQPGRAAPMSSRQQLPPPPPPPVHHGPGHWTGEGYSSPFVYSHPQSSLPSQHNTYQQGTYGQANKRPPLGPPPSARRGPASYYPQVGPVHPIVEETDSNRSSIRTGAGRDSTRSYNSSNAIPIAISDHYFQRQRSTHSLAGAERPFSEHPTSIYSEENYTRPPLPSHLLEHEGSSIEEELEPTEYARRVPSPEPISLVRHASYGRKSKPTLTTVKAPDRVRRAADRDGIAAPPGRQHAEAVGPSLETGTGSSDSRPSDDVEVDEKRLEADVAAADVAAPAHVQAPHEPEAKIPDATSTRENALAKDAGLSSSSSVESDEGLENQEPKRKPSREVSGSAVGKQSTSRSRDPSLRVGVVEADSDHTTSRKIVAELAAGAALHSSEDVSGKDLKELRRPNPGFSARAGKRRPSRLNVDAVRDAEARGSLTSLPDLIKRATRLASNLDRGKTASRLGVNWMEGASDPDYKGSDKRASGSITDMLANFPSPGINGTPPGSRNGFRSSWRGRNTPSKFLPSESDADECQRTKRGRRCCGMSLRLFIFMLLLLFALVAAAVVVPVVLVVLPKDDASASAAANDKALKNCQSDLKCANGGANVITATGSCKCVCVNGFTGSTCDTASEAACTTVSIGNITNATVGDQIPRLISGASSNFSVPLDEQTLLGLFSDNDLSCASENALVVFSLKSKRDRPALVSIERRQDTASNSGTPSDSTTLDFARVAVLYLFQVSGQLGSAVTAQSNLQKFFGEGRVIDGQSISASNVSLGNSYAADLVNYTIQLANGTTIG